MNNWQPMETAPTRTPFITSSVPRVLLRCQDQVYIGWFDFDQYAKKPRPYWYLEGKHGVCGMRADQPTGWMPLPEL